MLILLGIINSDKSTKTLFGGCFLIIEFDVFYAEAFKNWWYTKSRWLEKKMEKKSERWYFSEINIRLQLVIRYSCYSKIERWNLRWIRNYFKISEDVAQKIFKSINEPIFLFRSSRSEVSSRKSVLKTGEHPCRSAISVKLQSNFIEIGSPVNLLHIFRAPFPKNTLGWLLLSIIYFSRCDSKGRLASVD